ncbi:MAG TPA: hypothetical protein VFG14_01425, partial [Chthoniobacteraceae bacterium]|nr:hypothetical protein [Chthoniobacteraceae bacterium]
TRSTGASFEVKLDGESRWNRSLKGGATEPVEIDLSDFAGRDVTIAFEVNALGDPANDWATWIQPRVIKRPSAR